MLHEIVVESMAKISQPFTIGEDGKKRYTHKHWGTLDENLRFHPNATYLYASIEERSKLIFPKEWDLSELENLESNRKRGRVSYEADDVDRMYGSFEKDLVWQRNSVTLKRWAEMPKRNS